MQINKNEFKEIIHKYVQEQCEDVDSIIYRAVDIIVGLSMGDKDTIHDIRRYAIGELTKNEDFKIVDK